MIEYYIRKILREHIFLYKNGILKKLRFYLHYYLLLLVTRPVSNDICIPENFSLLVLTQFPLSRRTNR